MKKKSTLIILLIVFILISFKIVTSFAEDLTDIQEQKNELQVQINESNEELEEIKIELTENLEQLNNLNTQIETYQNEIDDIDKDLEELNLNIENVTKRLNIIENNYNLQKEALKTRLVAMYEMGDIVYLDVLLSSNSVSEFISNYYLIGEIAKYDNDILEGIEEQRLAIDEVKNGLEEKKQELKEFKNKKQKKVIALENSKTIRNTYINKLTEEERQTQSVIDECQSKLNALETQIVAITMQNIGADYVGGEFAWPAPGYTTITSKYGMRYHPVLKVNRIHTGNDIAMPLGSYIIAANDGIVITSSYTTGYGNTVMIDHGGGVVTLYGHGSEILVQTGQEVKRGDIIMKAGSTGWSTGPHLHFEVRINGQSVDSLPYITNQKSIEQNNNAEQTQENEVNE